MRAKIVALIGSAVVLLIAPGTIAGLVPWWITRWEMQRALFDLVVFRVVGAVLAAAGGVVLVESFMRFALKGEGTPAPMMPTCRLIVTGFYRQVRNPMYLGVLALIAGQGMLLGSAALLFYAALLWPIYHVFVILYEERALRQTYGAEYEMFCANVPRWVPRLKPRTHRHAD